MEPFYFCEEVVSVVYPHTHLVRILYLRTITLETMTSLLLEGGACDVDASGTSVEQLRCVCC